MPSARGHRPASCLNLAHLAATVLSYWRTLIRSRRSGRRLRSVPEVREAGGSITRYPGGVTTPAAAVNRCAVALVEVTRVSQVRAEGVGFEPTMKLTPHSGFQDRRHRPLGEPSADYHSGRPAPKLACIGLGAHRGSRAVADRIQAAAPAGPSNVATGSALTPAMGCGSF